jgi:hypothetical protein
VVRQPCLQGEIPHTFTTTVAPTTRSGGRKPPWTLFHIRTRSAEVHCICRHRLQYHGGLTPAALVNMRSPIAKIAFLPADARTATRSGGRQPPVDYENALATGRRRTVRPRPHCVRNTRPIAVCVSPCSASSSHGGLTDALAKIAFLPADARTATRSGGRKPPVVSKRACNDDPIRGRLPIIAIAAARITARLLRFAILLTCASSSHGGLTPAALVYVRARIARIAMSAANEHRATRSGGRKPPVVSQTRLQRRSPNTRETADAAPENLIAIAAARITARLLRFCDSPYMCVVEPRRAHARRSCARAFVHREWRFMQCTNVAHQERSV